MDKVVITKSKVDSLADKIRAKAGTSETMSIDEMGDVVEGFKLANKDGQFYRKPVTDFLMPKVTVTYNGSEI